MLVYSASKVRDAQTAAELWQGSILGRLDSVVAIHLYQLSFYCCCTNQKFTAIMNKSYPIKPTVIDCSQLVQAISDHVNNDVLASIWQYMSKLQVDAVACVCVLNACHSPENILVGEAIHTYVSKRFLSSTVSTSQKMILVTSIINMYSNCKQPTKAKQVWSELIASGTVPNLHVYCSMLSVCTQLQDSTLGESIFNHMTQNKVNPDIACYNALLNLFIKCGNFFHTLSLYKQIQQNKNVQPNISTYTNILIAYGEMGNFALGSAVYKQIITKQLKLDPIVDSCLIKMYSDCGRIDDALQAFEASRKSGRVNVIVWTTILTALAQYALKMFEDLSKQIRPNSRTFMAILTACSHTKMVTKALSIYNEMKHHQIQPTIEHHNALIDVLARAGKLKEAEDFALKLESPDLVTWKTILGACRTYNDVSLAKRAAGQALALDPQDPATYVLLANIYSHAKMWDDHQAVWTQMEANGVKKLHGKSWIEVNGKISYFLANDKSHPLTKQIYQQIEDFKNKLHQHKFTPETCFVTQDVHEDQKEHLLWYHSEKLAAAYGFLAIPSPQPITIMNNLRVCGDCHKAMEYISKIYKRDILIRDANRFHHFSKGKCSCNGFY